MTYNSVGKVALVAAALLGVAAAGPVREHCLKVEVADPKDRVHIFVVNGLDPLCVGNLNGLCDYLRDQGYSQTHFGRLITSHGFTDQIRGIRATDPDARIVLIGFSCGCNYVRSIANKLCEEDVRVDLLVYIAGDLIGDDSRSRPANVGRVVNIRSVGMAVLGGDLFYNREEITGGRNVRLSCRHFSAPSHPETRDVVLRELSAITCCAPAAAACRD